MGEQVVHNVGDTRFYESKYPKKDDLVVVKITRVAEMGAYVQLLEYSGFEGMILMSELSKRRIRSIKKLVRVGRQEVVLVLRVDGEKGYIDLSKKVSPEDVVKCEERFSKSKKVYQIMYHVAQKHALKLEWLNSRVTWPLQKQYGHALDAFQNPNFSTTILKSIDLPDDIKETLLNVIELRLASTKLKLRVRVDLFCYGNRGVEAVREALIEGKKAAQSDNPDNEVEIKLIASPQYMLITTCSDRAEGESRLIKGVKAMLDSITQNEGGDGVQGEIMLIGGDDDEKRAENFSDDESSSSSESESNDNEDEHEGLSEPDEDVLDVELPHSRN